VIKGVVRQSKRMFPLYFQVSGSCSCAHFRNHVTMQACQFLLRDKGSHSAIPIHAIISRSMKSPTNEPNGMTQCSKHRKQAEEKIADAVISSDNKFKSFTREFDGVVHANATSRRQRSKHGEQPSESCDDHSRCQWIHIVGLFP
jgi:hypothetical protein